MTPAPVRPRGPRRDGERKVLSTGRDVAAFFKRKYNVGSLKTQPRKKWHKPEATYKAVRELRRSKKLTKKYDTRPPNAMALNAHRYRGEEGRAREAAGATSGAASAAPSLGEYEYLFYNPVEAACGRGLGLVGVNTEEAANALICRGYLRFTELRLIDTRESGLERLPEAVRATTDTRTMTKEQLRREPPKALADIKSLPESLPGFHDGPGTVADKLVEQFEVKVVDEEGMMVYPPLRLLTKDTLTNLKASKKFKGTFTTRLNAYYAVKCGAISDDKLQDADTTNTFLVQAGRLHVRNVLKCKGFDYFAECVRLYDGN